MYTLLGHGDEDEDLFGTSELGSVITAASIAGGLSVPHGPQASVSRPNVWITRSVIMPPQNAFGALQPKDAISLIPASRWDIDAWEGVFGLGSSLYDCEGMGDKLCCHGKPLSMVSLFI